VLLFHDDLSETHQAFFFHEFMQRAAQHELQYLGEADFYEMAEQRFSPNVRETLAMLGDKVLVREQYMDFLMGRAFRQTLLCHAAQQLDRVIQPERLSGMYFASPAEPLSSSPGIAGSEEEEFRLAENATLKTTHPLAKAIFVVLGAAWPGDLAFDELLRRIGAYVKNVTPAALAEGLVQIYSSGPAVHFGTRPGCAAPLGERPKLSPLARLQAEAGKPVVSSFRHFSVDVRDPLFRRLLLLLDGTRDRAALVEALAAAVESGEIAVPPAQNSRDPQPLREQISVGLDRNLKAVARMALLVE
jgi:methyltransferase-like protein